MAEVKRYDKFIAVKSLFLHNYLFEIYFGEHGTLFSLNDTNHLKVKTYGLPIFN